MDRAAALPGQSGRNGHARARRESGKSAMTANLMVTAAVTAILAG
jgi:hypothetical protein